MRKVGIWIDQEKAHLVFLENEQESLQTIESEVDTFHVKGGSRSKTRWGPQEVVHDSKYLERRKHQLKRYFEAVENAVKDTDEIGIFGPAEVYLKLEAHFTNTREWADNIKMVQNVDSMTLNQVKALVRDSLG